MRWISILAFSVFGIAIATDFNLYSSEQVYLAPKEAIVAPGDSIAIEGVITCLAAGESLPYSQYAYIELIDAADSVIVRQKLPAHDLGRFSARIPTDDLIPNSTYYLRGYTQLMRNFSLRSFAQQSIFVGQRQTTDDGQSLRWLVATPNGALHPGELQYITTAIYSSSFRPKSAIEVALLTSRGDTVATTFTSMSGYATLGVIPEAEEPYRISADGELFDVKNDPSSRPRIEGALRGKRLVFQIKDVEVKAPKLFAYDRLNGLRQVELQGMQGKVTIVGSPRIVTLFLTDDEGNNLAEASFLGARNDDVSVNARASVKTDEKIVYTISCANADCPIIARIIKVDDNTMGSALEALTFQSDFSSPLPFPAWNALSTQKEREADLRAWLSNARFTRFDIKELLSRGDSIYKYLPETVLELKGRVENEAKKAVRDGHLVAYNTATFATADSMIQSDGRFCVEVEDFADGTEFFLQPLNAKGKPETRRIILDDATYPAVWIERPAAWLRGTTATSAMTEGSQMLGEVVVKARKITQNPPQLAAKSYYGFKAKDRETIDRRGYITLYDILRDMPSITVTRYNGKDPEKEDDGTITDKNMEKQWVIKSHRGASTLAEEGDEMNLIIDGDEYSEEQFDMILNWPAKMIESVEVLSPGEAIRYAKHPINGAVHVITRSHAEMSGLIKSKGVIAYPAGLTPSSAPSSDVYAPSTPGNYILQVDVVTPTGPITLMHPIEVCR